MRARRRVAAGPSTRGNPYYPRFKSHQLIIEDEGLNFKVNFSKQGLIALKTSSQDQAIEIVRRRIDEVGTNEPNILKRGNNRILVELPGLDDPMRVKSLLGKTANLTFRFVTKNENDNFGVEEALVSSVHSSTASQNIVDGSSKKDWRLGRSTLNNIIPTSTGAAKAVAQVLPELEGKITGLAYRIPIINGSLIDLTVRVKKDTSYNEIMDIIKKNIIVESSET